MCMFHATLTMKHAKIIVATSNLISRNIKKNISKNHRKMHSSMELATTKLYFCNIHKDATGTHGTCSCKMNQTWQGLDNTACGAHGRGQPADTVVGEGDGSRWVGSSLAARSFSARRRGSSRCAWSPLHGAALPRDEPPPLAGTTRLARRGASGGRVGAEPPSVARRRGGEATAREQHLLPRALAGAREGELLAAAAIAGSGAGGPSEGRAGPRPPLL
jgi:hypothetical protein